MYYKQTTIDGAVSYTDSNIISPSGYFTLKEITKAEYFANVNTLENAKKAKLFELDRKCKEYIYANIGDQEHQSKYLALFCSLQEKRLDGETLTADEIIIRDELKNKHSRYKQILAEYAVFITEIENDEDVNILFTK